MSIIPMTSRYQFDSAQAIANNMIIEAGKPPVIDGAQAVADAFHMGMGNFKVSCSDLGYISPIHARKGIRLWQMVGS